MEAGYFNVRLTSQKIDRQSRRRTDGQTERQTAYGELKADLVTERRRQRKKRQTDPESETSVH